MVENREVGRRVLADGDHEISCKMAGCVGRCGPRAVPALASLDKFRRSHEALMRRTPVAGSRCRIERFPVQREKNKPATANVTGAWSCVSIQ